MAIMNLKVFYFCFIAGTSVLSLYFNARLLESSVRYEIRNKIDTVAVKTNGLNTSDKDADNNGDNRINLSIANKSKLDAKEDQRQKPWLVLHVGPSKTGTTTIQDGLYTLAPRLASTDNVFFLGGIVGDDVKYYRYEENQNNNSRTGSYGIASIFRSTIFSTYENTDKSVSFMSTLKWHFLQKHNVVLSSELLIEWMQTQIKPKEYFNVYSRAFLQEGSQADRVEALKPDPPITLLNSHMEEREKETRSNRRLQPMTPETKERSGKDMRRVPEEHRRLSELRNLSRPVLSDKEIGRHAFHHDDSSMFSFDVKVVVAYRHYFHWLPSYYFQDQLLGLPYMNSPSLATFVENALNTLGEALGENYLTDESLLDFTNATALQTLPSALKEKHGTLYGYFLWSAPRSLRDRVEVFDMHQQQIIPNGMHSNNTGKSDVLRDFVCQALPAAANTCSEIANAEKRKTTCYQKGAE